MKFFKSDLKKVISYLAIASIGYMYGYTKGQFEAGIKEPKVFSNRFYTIKIIKKNEEQY